MTPQRRTAVTASHSDIKAARAHLAHLERLGMNRITIAQKAGVSPSTITRIASGRIDQLSQRTARALLAVKR